jgi:hypothetical protein
VVRQGEDEDSEEPTVVIREDEDEEPTELIARLEHDEGEDKDALENLESNLKGLRRLEKAIFPKPAPEADAGAEGTHEGQDDVSKQEASHGGGAAESAAPDAADEDPPEQVDRPGE